MYPKQLSLTHSQELHHRDHGDVDKCIDIMHQLIERLPIDPEQKMRATLGALGRLNIADKESTQPQGRHKFMLAALDKVVRLAGRPLFTAHLLAEFRTFMYHAQQSAIVDNQMEWIVQTLRNGAPPLPDKTATLSRQRLPHEPTQAMALECVPGSGEVKTPNHYSLNVAC